MKIRNYKIGSLGLRTVLLSDLHNHPYEQILLDTANLKPDFITIAGDVAYDYVHYHRVGSFLSGCAEIAPTFLSLGNHDSLKEIPFGHCIASSGAMLLDNSWVEVQAGDRLLRIGGLTSPTTHRPKSSVSKTPDFRCLRKQSQPDTAWLDSFCMTDAYKILLCHQPEFYPRYLEHRSIELVLSGHAHGGQWRIGSQGVFAPGQGIFPERTGGVIPNPSHDGKHVISRGLSNTTWIPRFFNPCEIVSIDL